MARAPCAGCRRRARWRWRWRGARGRRRPVAEVMSVACAGRSRGARGAPVSVGTPACVARCRPAVCRHPITVPPGGRWPSETVQTGAKHNGFGRFPTPASLRKKSPRRYLWPVSAISANILISIVEISGHGTRYQTKSPNRARYCYEGAIRCQSCIRCIVCYARSQSSFMQCTPHRRDVSWEGDSPDGRPRPICIKRRQSRPCKADAGFRPRYSPQLDCCRVLLLRSCHAMRRARRHRRCATCPSSRRRRWPR